ncbi:MAG: L,D-transpeptidase family protein [Myxococcota bacterium]
MRTEAATIGLACLLLAACDKPEPRTAPATPSAGAPAEATAPARPREEASPRPAPAEDAGAPPSPTPDADAVTLADIEPELEIPEEPQPPEGYGLIVPPEPVPAAEDLVIHAMAGYEVVAVYARADIDAPKLGYLRLGTRMMVTEKAGTDGCPKGWYGLPEGGFACASRGLVVDRKRPPYLHRPPPPPRTDEALPYDYAYVRKWNSAMWWRVPNAAEQKRATDEREVREAIREGKPLPGSEPAKAEPTATPVKADPAAEPAKAEPAKPTDLSALPSVDDPPAPAPAPAAAEPTPAAPAAEPATPAPGSAEPTVLAEAEPEEPALPPLPLNPQNPWLEKGFFISLGDKLTEEGKTWWHTARGAYVETGAAYKYEAKDFQGVQLGEESNFPFGYAMVKEAKLFELDEDGKVKPTGKSLERRTFVDLTEEIDVDGKAYMMTTDGQLLRKKELRLAEPQPVPEGVEPWERWVDVSLAKQMLVAYEGDKPVFVTLVSTGRKGTEEEPFDTPPGRFRIRSKHVSTTMDGGTASDGNYSIQDVPWAMFFEGSYALHGAFWHNGFGRVRSHGCVNLGPTDARWLFNWTTPFLPEGWHGVHAHEGSPGTTVIVRS